MTKKELQSKYDKLFSEIADIKLSRDLAFTAAAEAEAELSRLRAENAELRAGWCLAYAGTHAYTDDGELQDGRHPVIDFKRDPVDVIRSKMRRRNEIVLMGEDGG